MKVFFILDKWCHANKKFGPSAWESNFVTSFASLEAHNYCKFHFDEFRDLNPGQPANPYLLESIKKENPDFIFLIIYEEPTAEDRIISIESLSYIRDHLKIPIVSIFGDLEHITQVKILNILEPYVNLILYTALAPPGIRIGNPKLKYSWVPKDPQAFYFKEGITKDYDVSYFGTPKPDRMRLIKYLYDRGNFKIKIGGGERQENIPVQEYASLIRRTKICLSFSRAVNCHVTNARVFEVISCNSMLLEQAGMETPKILIPYTDYIPYFSKKDCLNKIIYYLKNDIEREEIARNSYMKHQKYFNARRFWEEIFEYIIDQKIKSKNNDKVTQKKNNELFWQQSISIRSIPQFKKKQYEKFPIKHQLYYQILNEFMISHNLYLIYRIYWKCLEFPKRVIGKIYRILVK